jgi:hypothetical protein
MNNTRVKLTSVKVIESLYRDFKTNTVNSTMNLQKLVNRSMHMYLGGHSIKENFETYDALYISGSRF